MIPHLRQQLALIAGLTAVALAAGCAFDISHVRQQPAQFTAAASPVREFVLTQEVKAKLGTGFPTVLKAGTHWRQVGRLTEGDVFATSDQIVMVEASNMYEAHLVVTDGWLKGFYLPVERSFVAVTRPILLPIKPPNPNQP
ncbi:MAG: hypothetical protein KIS67_13825 [Verrucomicrobiae bacterium]|nr:hypothetical protein [Verrucomicrobiae bacterium]